MAGTASLQRGHLRNFPFPLHSVSQCSCKAAISTTYIRGGAGGGAGEGQRGTVGEGLWMGPLVGSGGHPPEYSVNSGRA